MKSPRRFYALIALCCAVAAGLVSRPGTPAALANHTAGPSSVTIAGSLQDELGCSGDWQPNCANTHLSYDANDDVWQGVFNVPAGNWEYKAPLNNSWDENYGASAQRNGPNIPLSLTSQTSVKFYYDHKSHWVTSNRNSVIATAAGSFQSELGCSADWAPDCLRSWLQDPDGDGTYRFQTAALPAGDYWTKATINESWNENYGAGGAPNGSDIQFNVPANNAPVEFVYNASTHVLTVVNLTGDVQWDGLRHDTFDPYYRNPFGAVAAGTTVTLRFRTIPNDVTGVDVRIYNYNPATGETAPAADHAMTYLEDRDEGGTTYAIWQLQLTTPSSPAILYYKFEVTDGTDTDFYSDAYSDDHDNLGQGGEGAASDGEPFPAFQLTVYDPAFQTPAWLQNANVYQIFPDRFRNGDTSNDYCREGSLVGCPEFYGGDQIFARTIWNEAIGDPRQPGPFQNAYGTQFYGGDLRGIRQQLDYLQSVGVDTIYLNPIFKAKSNHRYDTDNFLEVDPALGGDAALAELVAAMNARGMRLILDGVFNHSSSDSLYFDRFHHYPTDGGCESLSSPYRSWYRFITPNVPCGNGDYNSWFGFDALPVFDNSKAEVRDFFYRSASDNVTKHWYDRGASGWRFDVATDLGHNWWNDYRPYAKTYSPEGPLVGEIWEDASSYLAGDQLDSVMNYRFRKNVLGFARGQADWGDNDNSGDRRIIALSPSQFDHALRAVREDYPEPATRAMLNLIDSHDTNRALYTLTISGDTGLNEAKERLRLAALFQFTYVGAPMVYYGDEAGLNSPSLANGPNGPEDDPYNRAPYPWADEAGDPSVYGPADAGLKGFYSTLARLRKLHEALRTGSFETLLTGDTTGSTTDNNTYAFAREGGGETVVVVLNNGAASNSAEVPVPFADGTVLYDALDQPNSYTVGGGKITISLGARSGAVLLSSVPGDLTPPVITCPANVEQFATLNSAAVVNYSVSASDETSGVTITSSRPSGTAFPVGTTTVSVTATDAAGNRATCSFKVTITYNFSGFFPPVENPPTYNT
ncbi:MAG TPA: alpha-amylase family glycosyl hydrolase, partial [Pyrinomonadaceae bacterium]|nr:alpha-amylase family glycosyl hydrolase [Pyrinomonadaceae bacterium]